MLCNPPGRPSGLNEDAKKRILDAVQKVLVVSQIAAMAKVSRPTLINWLEWGKRDHEENTDSIYADLWIEYNALRAEILFKTLSRLATCPKNYGALTWILEKCFREDFGKESDELRLILEKFELILQLYGKGEIQNA